MSLCDKPNEETRMDWLAAKLQQLSDDGLRRARRRFHAVSGGWIEADGRRVRHFASNDYLDLASDPRVVAAAQECLATGVGSRASALVSGRSSWHEQLEQQLAHFEGAAAAVLFPTGYAANVGTISALVEPQDLLFCDRWNHASLIDGCRLSGARLRVYRHSDLEGLRRELQKTTGVGRRWIVTDSVFSMDGDLAPLRELCDLAQEFNAELIVDEAHGTGVFGEHGSGVAELTGTKDRIAVRIGTLSKALGSLGGFVVGSAELIDWLWHRARSQVFSTALPPCLCAAANAALQVVQTEPQRRAKLHRLSQLLRTELSARGIEAMPRSEGPIVPVVLGDPDVTMATSKKLEEAGFVVGAIRPPTVPQGTSRLRISLTTAFEATDIVELAQAIGAAFNR